MNISYVDYFFFLFIFRYSYFSLDSIHCSLSLFLRTFVSSCLFLLQFFSHFIFFFFFHIALPFYHFYHSATHTVAPVSRNTSLNGYFFDTHTHQEIYIPLGCILSCEPLPGIPLESRADYPPPTFSSSFFTTTLSLRPCVFILWRWQIVLLHLSLHRVYSV